MTPIELLLSHGLASACCNSIYAKPRCLTEVQIRETLRTTIEESACGEQEARMIGYEEETGRRRELLPAERNPGLDSHCVTAALPGLRLQHWIRVSLPSVLAPARSNSFPKIPAPICVSAADPDAPNTPRAHDLGILTSQTVFRNEESDDWSHRRMGFFSILCRVGPHGATSSPAIPRQRRDRHAISGARQV